MEKLKLNIQLFAFVGASASASDDSLRSSAGNKATITSSFSQTSVNIETNKSPIDCVGTIKMVTGSFSQIGSPYLYLYWHDNKTNTDVEVAKKNVTAISKGQTITISGTIEVEHNNDGTLSGYTKTKWVYERTNANVPKSGEVQTELTPLTPIPRATSAPVISGNVEEKVTISLSPSSDTFTHNIKYEFGTLSGTIATGVSKTKDWTIPSSFYAQIGAENTSKKGTLIVETYSGGNLIGTSEKEFTTLVSEEKAKPTITITSVVDVNSVTTNLTGDSSKIILNASTARVTFTVTARASSNLESVTINGKTVSVTSGTSKTYDIAKINTNKVSIIATDSRDFQTSQSKTIATTIAYTQLTSNPTISRIVPVTNNQLEISGNGNYSATNFGNATNELTVRYRYKLNSETSYGSWNNVTPTIDTENKKYSFSATPSTTFDYTKIYNIQVQVYDKIITHTTTATIARGVPIFWISSDSFTVEVTFNNKSLESRKKNFEDFLAMHKINATETVPTGTPPIIKPKLNT